MAPTQLAAVQFEPAIGDVEANLDRVESLAASLGDSIRLAVFPELCATGYDLDVVADLAEPVPGPVTDAVVAIADRTGLHLAVGLPEADGGSLYNALVYATPDGVEASYRKQYRWGPEVGAFAVGEELAVVDAPFGRVGLLVCYDLNFPELGVEYARRSVDVLAVSSAWRSKFRHDWRLLTRARALDGTCYVVAANHTGDQRGRDHDGHSLVAGPAGTIVDELGEAPGAATAAMSAEALEGARRRNPVNRDRRPDDRVESSMAK